MFQRIATSLFPFLLGVLLALPAHAVTLTNGQQAQIDALFAAYDTPTSPGCALGVMSEGRMIYARGYGLATLDPAVAIDSDKVFDIASMSKQFTAAAIVRLSQQGKLKLTDDVRKYVPELPNYGAVITLNHLIWHTSGLRDFNNLLLLGGYDFSEVTTEALALDFIKRQQKLNFTPGSSYSYSNSGYFLLGLVVNRVSGTSLNAYSRQQFFNPLGMPQAVFRDQHDRVIPNLALGYTPIDAEQFAVNIANWEQVGDGGLHTSIEELQQWDENFYSGQVGGPAFAAEMQRTGKLSNGKSLIYARGLYLDSYRGLERVHHAGDWIGYHSNMQRFPDQHTTVAVLCNLDGVDQYTLTTDVADIVLKNQFTQPKPVPPPPAPSLPLDRFVGTYFDSKSKLVLPVRAANGQLVITYYWSDLPLISIGPTSFVFEGAADGTRIEFSVQGQAKATALTLKYADDPNNAFPLQASRYTPATPPADLNPFAGTYYSPELGVSWKLVVTAEGQLKLKKDAEQILFPLDGPLNPATTPTSFYGAAGFLNFTRNNTGQVTGFKVSVLGLVDIQFNCQ